MINFKRISRYSYLKFSNKTPKMRSVKSCMMVIVLVICSMPVHAQAPTIADTLKKVDLLFSGWNTATPGAAVSISRKGEVLYYKAFGMADLEHQTINTTETIFESGSVAKQFTAAAALILVLEGKISVQDDIRKYFPELPDYGAVITVEHLLHHTSGLRDWGSVISLSGWPRGSRTYTPAQVKEIIFAQRGLNFAPGTAYGYSNSNYNLLGFLVERVSGQRLQDFTYQKLFAPVGMTHTRWRDNYKAVVPHRAIAYGKVNGAYQQNMPFEHTFGHGAMLTTIGDLEKWNRRWTLATLGKELNALQKTKFRLANGKEIGYAGGVGLGAVNGVAEISHSGATAGYRAWLAYYPEKELSVVLLSNDADADPSALGNAIASIFFGEGKSSTPRMPAISGPITISKERLAGMAGLYKSMWSEDFQELSFSKDSLRFHHNNLALAPVAEHQFYAGGFTITFPKNTNTPDRLHFRNARGDTATYLRVQPFAPDEKALQAFTGAYSSSEAFAELKVQLREGSLCIIRFGDEKTILKPKFTDAFIDNDYNLYEFKRDAKGIISGFSASVSRARNVWFKKME